MSGGAAVTALVDSCTDPDVAGLPRAEMVLSPTTLEEAATLLRFASDQGIPCLLWGGGTQQEQGYDVEAAMVLTTRRLASVVDWQPEDLTIVVGAGMQLAELADALAERRQTAVLPRVTGAETVGGAVAVGASSWARYRYGPTRDRILQTRLVTGDGRLVTAGGRVVKNVTGYDVPRLVTGSHGALGLIGEVCLKLWPEPVFTGSVAVADPERAVTVAYRPLAVIETAAECRVYLGGTEADVTDQAARLGGELTVGIEWPMPLSGRHRWSLRVPPAQTAVAVDRCRAVGMADFQAAYGVGEVRLADEAPDRDALVDLRSWAEGAGGSLVRTAGDLSDFDPWGTPPPSLDLQRAVKSAFDPAGVVNPGRLPGRL